MEIILVSWKVDLNEGFVCLSPLFSIVLGKIPFYCLLECNIHIVMKKLIEIQHSLCFGNN